MIAAIFTVAILLADTTPAVTTPTPPAAAPKVNKDGLVCHTEEVLGSRIAKKVCISPADAADRAAQDRRNIERMQGSNNVIRN